MKKKLTKKEMNAILEKTLFTEQDVALLNKIGAIPDVANEWYVSKGDFNLKLSVRDMYGHNEYTCVTYVRYNPHREDGNSLEQVVNASIAYCENIVKALQDGIGILKNAIEE